MATDGLFGLLGESGLAAMLPRSMNAVFTADDSYIDEAIALALALCGLATQLWANFAIVFPLDVVLSPLTLIEWLLRRGLLNYGVGVAPLPEGALVGY